MKQNISDLLKSEFSPQDYLKIIKKPNSWGTRQKIFILEKPIFGIYDGLIRQFGGYSDIHFTFTASTRPNPENIRSLIKLLFSMYGRDSNGITFDQTPVLGPFNGELYCWCIDREGNIVNEDDDMQYGITFLHDEGKESELIIHEVQEVLEFQR